MHQPQPMNADRPPTMPAHEQLFSNLDKAEAITIACKHLADLHGKTPSPESLKAYVRVLVDLPPEAIARVFAEAEFKWGRKDGFPLPKDLRDLAGAGSSSGSAADLAWSFCADYVRLHGCDGHDRMVAISPGSYRCFKAPEIPEAVKRALEAIGRGVRGGLHRIAATNHEHMGLLRADFDRAYARNVQQSTGLVVMK